MYSPITQTHYKNETASYSKMYKLGHHIIFLQVWFNLTVFWQFISDLKLIHWRCVWMSARVQCAGTRRLHRTSALWFGPSVTAGTGSGGVQVRNYQSKHPQLRFVHAAILLSVINFINKFNNFQNSRHLPHFSYTLLRSWFC